MRSRWEERAGSTVDRPDIYGFHDYQDYLRAWLAYQKASQPGFSFRALAKQTGVAMGYLPMVLSGQRKLSAKAMNRLLPALGLDQDERYYFECLVTLGTSDLQQVRLDALERMRGFRSYQKKNPRETEVYEYLTHWYYVAIREMASLPDFKADPEWIQRQLRTRLPLGEIREALKFLTSQGFIQISPDGSIAFPDKDIKCLGGVFRVAIVQYHKEMFSLAAQSLESIPSEERSVTGHTMAIASEDFNEVRKILSETLERVEAVGKRRKKFDSVYHVILAAVPLTQLKRGNSHED